MDDNALKGLAARVIDLERDALDALHARIDDSFVEACRLLPAQGWRLTVAGRAGRGAAWVRSVLSHRGHAGRPGGGHLVELVRAHRGDIDADADVVGEAEFDALHG